MGQVPGKVEVRLYVYPEIKEYLKAIAVRTGLKGPTGRWDLGQALEFSIQETIQRARLKIPKDSPAGTWNEQAEALAEKEYQRNLRRIEASKTVNARRRASERSTRYIEPEDA